MAGAGFAKPSRKTIANANNSSTTSSQVVDITFMRDLLQAGMVLFFYYFFAQLSLSLRYFRRVISIKVFLFYCDVKSYVAEDGQRFVPTEYNHLKNNLAWKCCVAVISAKNHKRQRRKR